MFNRGGAVISIRKHIFISIFACAAIAGSTSCTAPTHPYEIPYVPSEYLSCVEVNPNALLDAYYGNYGDTYKTGYKDLIFIFKNIEVTTQMVKDKKKGWIWVDLIKCYLRDGIDLGCITNSQRIDVIGVNDGIVINDSPGLVFRECLVIPSGIIQLPAEGSGGYTVYPY